MTRYVPLLALAVMLTGCAGVLRSNAPPEQAYVLRAAPPAASRSAPLPLTVLVQHPGVHPGLDSVRIALTRPGNRLDHYAGARWAGPLADVVEAFAADTLRAAGRFAAVNEDGTGPTADVALILTVRRFDAEYAAGDGPPVAHVAFDCQLANVRPRRLLGDCSAAAAVPAAANRLGAVVAALEAAAREAMGRTVARAADTAVAAAPAAAR